MKLDKESWWTLPKRICIRKCACIKYTIALIGVSVFYILFFNDHEKVDTYLHMNITAYTTGDPITDMPSETDKIALECPKEPPDLGDNNPSISEFNGEIVNLTSLPVRYMPEYGGWWQPHQCQASSHTAVIIPYRDREDNLHILLRYLHPMLQRQLLHYRIFVAEQHGNGTFNKGQIMNSAFKFVQSQFPVFDCFIFHDVDMVPENERNLYRCGAGPRHLSAATNKFNYSLPYPELIGGVLAFNANHFRAVNGYSNVYWGWGGEDDDMYYRIKATGLKIERPSSDIGRYTMLNHVKRWWLSHTKTYQLLGRWRVRHRKDGLNSVKYVLISSKPMELYTHILVWFESPDNGK